MRRFKKGDRVRMTELGVQKLIKGVRPGNTGPDSRTGTVAGTPREGKESVLVTRDGRNYRQQYAQSFGEVIPEGEG